MLSHVDLMTRHVEALFTHDDRGRISHINEPGGALAPRFFLGRSAGGSIRRYRFDLPQPLVERLEAACRTEPLSNDLDHAPGSFSAYMSLLEEHAPVEKYEMGPAFVITDRQL